jgi:hypothetical protein
MSGLYNVYYGSPRKATYGQIQGDYEWLQLWRQLYAYITSSFGLGKFKRLILLHRVYQKLVNYGLQNSLLPPACTAVSRAAQSVQWLATDWETRVRSLTEAKDFSSNLCTQPALGPTQPPVKWVPGIFSWGKCGRGVLLTTHPVLVPPLPQCARIGASRVTFTSSFTEYWPTQ